MRNVFVPIILAIILLITGCMKKSATIPPEPPAYNIGQVNVESRASRGEEIELKLKSPANERMVIRSAYIHLQALEQDTVHAKVIKLAEKYQGYVLSSGSSETVIRIPYARFNEAICEIESFGDVADKNIRGEDISEEYQDLNIRLENAEKTRQRYLILLDKANNVSEMLRIEAELERVNVQIESLKGRIEKLSHLVEHATITVNTSKIIRPGPVGYVFYGMYKGLEWLFVWK